MDDDVVIPRDMSWQTDKLKKKDIAGAVITIRADMNFPKKDSSAVPNRNESQCKSLFRRSFLVWFQDMYLEKDVLIEILDHHKFVLFCLISHHSTAFHGEDALMGFLTRELMPNKKLITFAATPALTQVPADLIRVSQDLFGDESLGDKSLFNQRVKSWDACAHRFFFKYLEHLLRFWSLNTLILKPFYMYELVTIIRDYFHLLIISYFIIMKDGYLLGLIYIRVLLIQYVIFFIFNYVKLRRRKDLQAPLLIVFLFPFYRLLLSFFRIFALFHNLFEYVPKKRMPTSEDPNLKVPYLHDFLSKLQYPEQWQKVWSLGLSKKT
ncbi:hypothetical protein GEMRC1_001248 [Eukaryota sp. GEM-RC1]